jgi:zinc protease
MIKELVNRSVAPKFIIPERFDFQKVESFCLSNGTEVFYINAGNQPVVKLEFNFKGGSSVDGATFASFFACKMLDQGTKTKSKEEIADYIAFRGGSIEIISGNDRIIINVFCLVKHLEDICMLLEEMLNQSKFSQADFTHIKEIECQNLLLKESKNNHLAGNHFVEKLFPNHYYGKKIHSELLQSIDFESVEKFYLKNIKDNKFELFVSGQLDDAVLSTINKYFKSNTVDSRVEDLLMPMKNETGKFILPKEASLQSSVRYGFQTIDKIHEDYALLSITNEIFGGYFGSRLMSNIREDKGYTYGIGSNIVQLKKASYFQISTDVKAENGEDTLREIQFEIDKMCTDLVDLDELEKVKNYIFGTFANSLNTPFELMDKLRAVQLIDRDYSFFHHYFEKIKEASPRDIQEMAQKYLTQVPLIVVCG